MTTGPLRRYAKKLVRSLNRAVVLFVLCGGQLVAAQESTPLSSSVVLVLRLISSTHVQPTTGVVISDTGLVLVSSAFVAEQADSANVEIVVLDGGTDIFSNGRPASVVHPGASGGLAVLSVAGLKRPGITLSDHLSNDTPGLHLQAFPPAKQIAKGEPPLHLPVEVMTGQSQDGSGFPVTISPQTPLPYLSGAVIDDCGFLAGVSLTQGLQSLDIGEAPVTMWVAELTAFFRSIDIALPRATCEPVPVQAITVSDGQNNPATEPALTDQQAIPDQSDQAGKPAAELPLTVAKPSSEDTGQAATADAISEGVTRRAKRPSLWRSIPLWIPFVGFVLLAVLIWKGMFYFSLRKPRTLSATGVQPASAEPDTRELQPGTATRYPRSAPLDDVDIPDIHAMPDSCDGVVMIDGWIDTETHFRQFCFVDTQQFEITIGRGEADIRIHHPAVSRVHARLQFDGQTMTLSDLGSTSGTFIRDIPCLPGEIMFLETADDVFLGTVRCQIRVINQGVKLA